MVSSKGSGRKKNPTVLSETAQEYLGLSYWLCGLYFQRHGKRLHRSVWEENNGPIPKGMHIHHIDGDRANNKLGNLALLSSSGHSREHYKDEKRRAIGRRVIKSIQAKAAEWHGSPAGIEWHKKHFKEHSAAAMFRRTEKECRWCGGKYLGLIQQSLCSRKCIAAERRASGIDDEDRKCVECGATFRANKYSKIAACSRGCGTVVSARKRNGVRQPKRT